jgi:hypothetical protein
MDNDDRPVGHILTRREVLALLSAAGADHDLPGETDWG